MKIVRDSCRMKLILDNQHHVNKNLISLLGQETWQKRVSKYRIALVHEFDILLRTQIEWILLN